MSNENELLEPLATEAGQEAIVRAIRDISSLEYAVRAEQAASQASAKAGEASQSALEASEAEDKAKDWATKTDTYVEQQIITIPPAQEGEEPTTETINLYSARYYAALVQDIYNNMSFDSVPTENSNNMVSSGVVYSALDLKADKSTTYTKTEVDTALSNVQGQLTFDNVPTANSDNPVKSSGIKTVLDGKQDTLTFDSTPTANSTNPVTSGGVYTALQNVDIDVDTQITENSNNPVTSAAIYAALQNFTPSGGGSAGGIASGMQIVELWGNTSGWLSGEITLNDSYKNYDLIAFNYGIPNESPTSNSPIQNSQIVAVQQLEDSRVGRMSIYGWGQRSTHFTITSDTKFNLLLRENDNTVYKIYGIKFSKNLSEQMYSNILYENASGWSSGSITLNDSLENYDFITLEGFLNGESPKNYFSDILLLNTIHHAENNRFVFTRDSGRYICFSITDYTQLTVTASSGYKIDRIVGYKMAKGGYSGIVSDARMTVKSGTIECSSTLSGGSGEQISVTFDNPMPDTNYTVSFCSLSQGAYSATLFIRVDTKTVNGFVCYIYNTGNGTTTQKPKFDWVAIRPNSYTREGMVEDVLYTTHTGFTTGTINLSGNISDYDLIEFVIGDSTDGEKYTSNHVYSSSVLTNIMGQQNKFFYLVYYGGGWQMISVDSDNQLSCSNRSGNTVLYKIIGIKFGRYVSGVAVDTTVTQGSSNVVTSGAVYDALQNYTPSGGGSSITVDSTITQGGTNPVEGGAIYTALGNKADKSTTYTKTEVDTALASKGDVTTNTDQNITGTKTFVGSKKVGFKQSTANDKLGFTLYGNTGTERGYLEFNPTNTIDGVAGLMTLGNYATSAGALTHVGFRRYSNISGANGAYNLLTPLIADAKTPFSLTTTYTNFYLPLGFTNGTTTVRTAKSGLVDLSPLLASLEARIAALEGN